MNNPEPSRWRGWTAAGVVAATILAVIAWPREDGAPPRVAPPPRSSTAPAAPIVPQPLPLLDRAGLMDAAGLAASAFAAGRMIEAGAPQLAGRRLRLILPFGCGGPDDGDGPLNQGWRFDEGSKTLRIAVTPVLFAAARAGQEDSPTSAHPAREGFWIDYPWLREPVCPAMPTGTEETASMSSGTLAIVRLMATDEPRQGRAAGSPYRLSVRTEPTTAPGADGLRLVIEGRFDAGEEPPVQCSANSASQRPTCVFAARFERVAITSADGKVTHGAWLE